jgi:copper chaperone NosL
MMTVSDERYGTELVTQTGKHFTFDSIECLAAYVSDNPDTPVHSLWVTAFDSPGQLQPAESALFLHSDNLRSPMGMNLTAFGEGMTPEAAVNAFAGEVMSWNEVVDYVSRNQAGAGHAH